MQVMILFQKKRGGILFTRKMKMILSYGCEGKDIIGGGTGNDLIS